MVNVNKLKGRIVESGLSIDALSDETGISKATIYRRLNRPEEITIEEADKIVKALTLVQSDAMAVFFAQFVS